MVKKYVYFHLAYFVLTSICLAKAWEVAPGTKDNELTLNVQYPSDASGIFCEIESVPDFITFAAFTNKDVDKIIKDNKEALKSYFMEHRRWLKPLRQPNIQRAPAVSVKYGPINTKYTITFDVLETTIQGETGSFVFRLGDNQGRTWLKTVDVKVTGDTVLDPKSAQTQDKPAPGATGAISFLPNPFRTTTNINFSTRYEVRVKANVYNIEGRLVRTLVDEKMSPGFHTVTWNGRNDQGRQIANGIYFVKIDTGDKCLCNKVTLIK